MAKFANLLEDVGVRWELLGLRRVKARVGPSGFGGKIRAAKADERAPKSLFLPIAPLLGDAFGAIGYGWGYPSPSRNRTRGSSEVHADRLTRLVPICPDSTAVFHFPTDGRDDVGRRGTVGIA
jgi:hypothetical protein